MSTSPEVVLSCSSCGASIYPEHFQRGLAVRQSGQIYCRHCMDERAKATVSSVAGVASLGIDAQATPPDRMHGSSLHGGVAVADDTYAKPPHRAQGASRMRTFHAKLSEGAVFHLDQQVNAWLDSHPDIEIKFATTTVGVWEGKHPEPNLILTIFY